MIRNLLIMACVSTVACVDTTPQPIAKSRADSMFLVLDELESWRVQEPSELTSGVLLDQDRALVDRYSALAPTCTWTSWRRNF